MNVLKSKEYLEKQKEIIKKTMSPEMLLAKNESISAN